jgi:hypothetical protein
MPSYNFYTPLTNKTDNCLHATDPRCFQCTCNVANWPVHHINLQPALTVLRTSVPSLDSSDVRVISLNVSAANTLPAFLPLTRARTFSAPHAKWLFVAMTSHIQSYLFGVTTMLTGSACFILEEHTNPSAG